MDERRALEGARRRLGVQDALWLEMDRPHNLMVVDFPSSGPPSRSTSPRSGRWLKSG